LAARGDKCDKFIDETGKRYGKLTVIEKYNKGGRFEHVKWLCRCDCGRIEPVNGYYLRRGMRTMCNQCAAELRAKGIDAGCKLPKDAVVHTQELRFANAGSTVTRLRKLRRALRIGDTYRVNIRLKSAEEYTAKCTLIAKYPKFALFKSERGLCYCFGYHAIMTEEIVYTDELTPRRVTA
jgi:hypothetical protein